MQPNTECVNHGEIRVLTDSPAQIRSNGLWAGRENHNTGASDGKATWSITKFSATGKITNKEMACSVVSHGVV